jgi:hypothetical protein
MRHAGYRRPRLRGPAHNVNTDRFSSVYSKYKGGRPPNPVGPDRRGIAAVIGVTLSA